MGYKVDFHTHSVASPDGALREQDYERIFALGSLDCIAVTDHNTTKKALEMHKIFGDRIIVGEEITSRDGEIIGLYLAKTVAPGLSAQETVRRIKEQGGLVYVPHPFETVRKGLALADLNEIAKDVDIVEAYNGRAVFQNRSSQALAWAGEYNTAAAASSDSHGRIGWGKTYTVLESLPTRKNLLGLLENAQYIHAWPGVRGVLYPKFNRIRKRAAGKRHD